MEMHVLIDDRSKSVTARLLTHPTSAEPIHNPYWVTVSFGENSGDVLTQHSSWWDTEDCPYMEFIAGVAEYATMVLLEHEAEWFAHDIQGAGFQVEKTL